VRPVVIRMLEGRTGSTLLMQLLATSPAIACDRVPPFEHSYLTYFQRVSDAISRRAAGVHSMEEMVYDHAVAGFPFDPLMLDGEDFSPAVLSSLWEVFTRRLQLGAPGAELYAEKFWGDVPALCVAGLDPLVIDLVRDPRDVLASIRSFNERRDRPLFGRARAGDDARYVRELAARLAMRFRDLSAAVDAPRIVVRYEDMARAIDGEAARISEHLGVSLHPGRIPARSTMAGHITTPTLEASVGRWRRDLVAEDVATIERRCGRHMLELGYELARPSQSSPGGREPA
jgi:hypothetical protein